MITIRDLAEQIVELKAKAGKEAKFLWGTAGENNTVILDGETEPIEEVTFFMPADPTDRVLVLLQARQATVIARAFQADDIKVETEKLEQAVEDLEVLDDLFSDQQQYVGVVAAETEAAKQQAIQALEEAFLAQGGVQGALQAVENLDNRVTPALTAAQNTANQAAQDLAAEKVRVQAEIDQMVSDHEAAFEGFDERMGLAEADLVISDGRLDAADLAIAGLDGRVEAAGVALGVAEGRISAAEVAVGVAGGLAEAAGVRAEAAFDKAVQGVDAAGVADGKAVAAQNTANAARSDAASAQSAAEAAAADAVSKAAAAEAAAKSYAAAQASAAQAAAEATASGDATAKANAAKLAAEATAALDAKNKADAAQAAAEAKAATAQAAANSAQSKADKAESDAAAAHAAATTADGKAVAAQTAASNAQTKANKAESDAAAAQGTANTAASDLLSLAGKTGRVIRSASAPVGEDRNGNNLWLNTGTGQLSEWTGTAWAVITDSRLTAASDAADQAANLAGNAQAQADLAKSLAEAAEVLAASAGSAASAAQDDLDNLQIGGRNLIRGTSLTPVVLPPSTLWYREWRTKCELELGVTYTYSIVVDKLSEDSTPINLTLGMGVGASGGYVYDMPNALKRGIPFGTRVAITFTTTEAMFANGRSHLCVRLRNEKISTSIQYYGELLEHGNKATDWSPAPEDVDASISLVDNKAIAAQAAATAAGSAAASAQSAADSAAADAVSKSAAAEAAAKAYALAQANAAETAAKAAASSDATAKANAAKAAAEAAAALDATTKANAAEAAAKAVATAAQTVANQAGAAAALAQSTADTASAKATTADGRYTVATTNPTAADAAGKPLGAVWEVRSGGTVLRKYVLTAATTWTQVKAGQDFIGEKAIGQAQIGDAAIGTLQVADAAITNAKIGNLAVGAAQIQALAVEAGKIKDAAITSAKIENLAVTNAKIANTTIETGKIKDAAITNAKIENLAVSTAKIADAAIETGKIKDLAVETGKIKDAAITNAKIENLAVDNAKIANATIESGKIKDLQVDKITATGGAKFPVAVIDTLVGDTAYWQKMHVEGAITVGGPNKVGSTLISDKGVTAPKLDVTGAMKAKFAEIIDLEANTAAFNNAVIKNSFIGSLVGNSAFLTSLYTNRLIVDGYNYAPGPGGYQSVYDLGADTSFSASANDPTGWAIRIDPRGASVASRSVYGPQLPVTPGSSIFVGVYKTYSGTGDNARFNIRFYFYDAAGEQVSNPLVYDSGNDGDGNWATRTITGTVEVPATAVTGRIRFYVYAVDTPREVWFRNFNVRAQTGAVLIEDGAVLAEKLAAQIVLASEIIAGNPGGTHAKMDSTGLSVFRAQPEGNPSQVISLGVTGSKDFLTIADTSGSALASIDDEGGISGTVITSDAEMEAESFMLSGAEPDTWVSEMVMRPIVSVGIGVNTWGLSSDTYFDGSTERRILEFNWENEDDASHEVWIPDTTFTLNALGGGSVTMRWRYTLDGVRPTTSSGVLSTARQTTAATGYETISLPSAAVRVAAGATLRVVLTGNQSNGYGYRFPYIVRLRAYDLGRTVDREGDWRTFSVALVKDTGATAPAPPAVDVKKPKKYVKTYKTDWAGSFYTSGLNRNTSYGDKAAFGVYGGLSRLKGAVGFDQTKRNAIISDLSGATITKIEAYVHFNHWYYGAGGSANVGIHGHLGRPAEVSSSTSSVATVKTKNPGGKWVTLPSSTYAGFKSGSNRGLLILSQGTGAASYGICDYARLRFSYEK